MTEFKFDQTLGSVEADRSQEVGIRRQTDAFEGIVWIDSDDEPVSPQLWRTSSHFPMEMCSDEEDSISEESEEGSDELEEESEAAPYERYSLIETNHDHMWYPDMYDVYRVRTVWGMQACIRHMPSNHETRATYKPGSWYYDTVLGWTNGPSSLPPEYPATGVLVDVFFDCLLMSVEFEFREVGCILVPTFLWFSNVSEKVSTDWLELPLRRRPLACIMRDMFPLFHSESALKGEIADELAHMMPILINSTNDTVLFRIIALYFAGVDLRHYFGPTMVKSARPYGVDGGIKKQKPARRGTRGQKKNGAINKSLSDSHQRALGNKDADAEVKKEKALPQCFLCKEVGHKKFDCPKSPICTVCERRGHEAHSCRKAPAEMKKDEDEDPIPEPDPAPPSTKSTPTPPCLEIVPYSDPIDGSEWPDRSKRKKTGIVFFTNTKYFYSVERQWALTPMGKAFKLYSLTASANLTWYYSLDQFWGSMWSKLACRMLNGWAVKSEELRTVHRVGGFRHEIDLDYEPYDHVDSRSDYLSIGDVKHTNPLYCQYSVTHQSISNLFMLTSVIRGTLYRCGLINSVVCPVRSGLEDDLNDALPKSLVSKELFYNNANSRIGPHVSDASAMNTISMSLNKSPLINLSKRFIEENDCASGGSDEAVTRTREALLDFRAHLKEEQVNRHLNKVVRTSPEKYLPGVLNGQPPFEADSSDALN